MFSIVAVLVCIPTKSVREFPFLHFISSIWPVMLEKTLESPLYSKEIQRVNPKGNQSWIYFGRTDAEAEAQILGPPDVKNWLIWTDPDAGKDWPWDEKGITED